AESAFDNPQDAVGPDILARIHYADQAEGLKRLNELIISGLNREIYELCRSKGIEPQNIYAISVAGNTTMTHLFMELNPRWIIREPYIPVVNTPPIVKAQSLGVQVNPQARVLIFPNIGSYFGGDLIAGILYSELYKNHETAILVDVGTNAEVTVGNKNWLIACAGAAGPALEGGVTRMGMTAGPGVIDKIAIDPSSHEIEIRTIEDKPPKGICGSGVIDLAAQLYLSGMIDLRGKFVPTVCGSRLKEISSLLHLVVVPADQSATRSDLTISQADLDSLIRSKAAMYTILETITTSVGMSLKELHTFYVAGTFGSFIDPLSAITIGMLPDLPRETYKPLGNSSLGGATLALTSAENIAEIDRIRDRITYLELNVNQEFMNRFSAAKFLPHTDPTLFPSVKKGI
ncbi:MAG: ASKHA domain-containing protein, partial [Desulfobacterales bacterium]